MKTARRKEGPLEVLERIQYKAPFKSFNPHAFPAFYTKHTHPIRYLDSIGIDTITDLLLNQFSPKEIATVLQVSQHILMRWVEADVERGKAWEWALVHEADNLMFEARDKLESAFVPADKALDKAERIANHNRLMAKGFGPKRWGQKVDVSGISSGAGVTYNFNVALLPKQQEQLIKEREKIIEYKKANEEDEEGLKGFSLEKFIGSGVGAVDLSLGLKPKEELDYEEAQAQESTEAVQQEQEGQS